MAQLAESTPSPQVSIVAPEEDRERREFRQTFSWVTGVHLFVLLLFFVAGFLQSRKKPEEITWLLGGEAGGGEMPGAAAAANSETEPDVVNELPPPPQPPEPLPDPPEALPPRPSEIALPKRHRRRLPPNLPHQNRRRPNQKRRQHPKPQNRQPRSRSARGLRTASALEATFARSPISSASILDSPPSILASMLKPGTRIVPRSAAAAAE